MPCAGVCVGASPMHANVPVCAGLTAWRCRSCVRVRFPLLAAMDRHTPMDRYSYTVHAHALPCTPIVERAYRRGGHATRTRTGVRHSCMRARSCVCVGAPASAPTRASCSRRRQASCSLLAGVLLGFGLQREYRRVEHRFRHDVVPGMRRFRPARAPRRTALGRSSTHARPLCASPMCACMRM